MISRATTCAGSAAKDAFASRATTRVRVSTGAATAPGARVRGHAASGYWRRQASHLDCFGLVFVFAFCGVLFPLASSLWDGGSDDQADGGIDGFEDIGGSAEPLTANELYSEDSYTFRIELADGVMEGELHLIEAFNHPDCAAGRTEAAERATRLRSRWPRNTPMPGTPKASATSSGGDTQ